MGDLIMTSTTLRLPDKVIQTLKIVSVLERKSMNAIISQLIEDYLEDYKDLKDAQTALNEEGTIPWDLVKAELGL